MAKPTKIKTLAVIREIPFNQLVLSQANVRTVKTGVSPPSRPGFSSSTLPRR